MNDNILNAPPQYQNAQAGNQFIRNNPNKKPKKKKNKFLVFLRKLLTVIATTLLSLFLVMIITGTIVCTALTVYVLDFMEESTSITLQELESGSDTVFYGVETDEEGNEKITILHRVTPQVQRIPVSIDRIPQHVRNAFVYTEDERFYTHDGVDYKRTFSAFLNLFLHIYDTEQGGSTITQQLIKNLTGDNEHSPQRKIREIFSAMQLEKTYSKDEILEEYLNYIGFGGAVNGIQLASIRYFGKNVEELTIPEAAVLAAIPKSPEEYGPRVKYYNDDNVLIVDGRANNKGRQEYVLYKLYENGAITYDEYQEYLNTKLIYTDSPEYLAEHPEDAAEQLENKEKIYSWTLDAMYFEAAEVLMEQFNIDEEEAIKRINKGGYKIYSTVDNKMQTYVEEKFLDLNNLMDANTIIQWRDLDGDGEAEEYVPHVGFVALNYDGSVRALVGNWGKKQGSLVTNFAVRDKRAIGSTIKPISTYGLALQEDKIHWGSIYTDKAIMELNGKPWPTNYASGDYISISNKPYPIYYLLQQSFNTVPAQLCQELTPHAVYEFCKENMGMELDPSDEALSPLSVGSLTYGLTLQNLVNAYIPYGNEGIYNEAHVVTKIEDSNQQIIYMNDGNPRRAVSDETAWVMNRLLKNVVDNGTGTAAQLSNKVVCGKTGTTENWWDLAFVGLTRDFVSGVTIGYKLYDERLSIPSSIKSAKVWYNIIGEYANTEFANTEPDFESVKSVIQAPICTISGKIATQSCTKGVIGYWKSTNAPMCDGNHYVPSEDPEEGEGGEEGGGDVGGGDVGGGDVGGGDVGGGDVGGGDVGGGDVGG
ncbi:MAG: transglycosylase domain-containing protein, partial [Ruminococcus sp.]|nr:transglycosylase domain-containing protein [Ruminococcus sp.]